MLYKGVMLYKHVYVKFDYCESSNKKNQSKLSVKQFSLFNNKLLVFHLKQNLRYEEHNKSKSVKKVLKRHAICFENNGVLILVILQFDDHLFS